MGFLWSLLLEERKSCLPKKATREQVELHSEKKRLFMRNRPRGIPSERRKKIRRAPIPLWKGLWKTARRGGSVDYRILAGHKKKLRRGAWREEQKKGDCKAI